MLPATTILREMEWRYYSEHRVIDQTRPPGNLTEYRGAWRAGLALGM